MKFARIAVAGLLAFGGCATPRTSIGPAVQNAKIERGVTTQSDLVAQLGPPQGRGLDSKGRVLLTWNRIDAAGTGKNWIPVAGPFLPGSTKVHKRQLAVSMDAEGRVADYKLSDEEHGANILGTTD
jgi:hypothetical protein